MKILRSLLVLAALLLGPLAVHAQPVTPPTLGPYKNLLVCGDFGTCPWQGGTSFTGIASVATYTADQWIAYGSGSSSVTVTQSTTAASLPPGFADALNFGRGTGSNTTAINLAQLLDPADITKLQGQTVSISFWMAPAANFSGTSVTVSVVTGTGTTTVGGNYSATNLANLAWTNQTTTCSQAIPFTSSSALTRFFPGQTGGPFTNLTCTIPATATEVALLFTYTPVGTAGATDAIALSGVQMEAGPTVTSFERRSKAQELSLAQYWAVVYTDSASALVFPASCTATSTTATLCSFQTPVPMRVAPTPTWSNTTSFGFTCGSTANAAASAWAVVASSATINSFGATATTGTTTAGFGCIMTGKNTAATLTISARL